MKKILFITANILPCISGDSIYSYGIVDRLLEESNVDILTFNKEDLKNNDEYSNLLKRGVSVYSADYDINLINKITKFILYKNTIPRYSKNICVLLEDILSSNDYDVIIIDHLRMAFLYNTIIKNKKDAAKIILVEHNIEYSNIIEEIENQSGINKIKSRLKNIGVFNFEKKILKLVDEIWCISDSDKMEINKINKDSIVKVINPYFPYKRIKYEYEPKKQFLILGSMGWYPNVEGAIWFIENIFYKIIDIDPEYKLFIVGNKPSSKLLGYASDNIIITGRVPSVDEYIINSDFLIVPNKLGGGVKIKILEGILKGIPVLSVKESLAGYEDIITDDRFIIDDCSKFIDEIFELNKDYNLKNKYIEKLNDKIKKNKII